MSMYKINPSILSDYLSFQKRQSSKNFSASDFSRVTPQKPELDHGIYSLKSVFKQKSLYWGIPIESIEFVKKLDEEDTLAHFQQLFCIPKKQYLPQIDLLQTNTDEDCIYLCGHSLGLKPKLTDKYVQEVLDNWSSRGVHSHFSGSIKAAFCDLSLKAPMAKIVGALPDEIAFMNGLSVNLHLLLATFYQPTSYRNKILIEEHAFSSDIYVVTSHLIFHGLDPKNTLLTIKPRFGEHVLREEDIIAMIKKEEHHLALILLPGVQYYTGQLLNIERLTEAAHNKGIFIGLDAAHAVGNVPLYLHDWGIDFAVWCTYKYLNSGPGGIGGLFVHQNHTKNGSSTIFPMLKGWWGNNSKTRFLMRKEFDACIGADMFRISNPSPLLVAPLMASLDIFNKTSMKEIWKKQLLLTGYLEFLLHHYFSEKAVKDYQLTYGFERYYPTIEIITPSDPTQRGSQLSLMFPISLTLVQKELQKRGVVCDIRSPNVMRVTPNPLYNSFMHIYLFVEILKSIFNNLSGHWNIINEKSNEALVSLRNDSSKILKDSDFAEI